MSTSTLLGVIKQEVAASVWRNACGSWCGKGLDAGLGPDIAQLKKHIGRLKRRECYGQAGMLATSAAGGCWTQCRKCKAGLVQEDLCSLCGECLGNEEGHIQYRCAVVNSHDAVRELEDGDLCASSAEGIVAAPALWLRGIGSLQALCLGSPYSNVVAGGRQMVH